VRGTVKSSAVCGHDADVGAGDWEEDRAVAVSGANGDVAQLAEVAQGDLARRADAVATTR
jgi:hypothetical protein